MEKRIAVVTGGNKGIGLETCRQLASNGVRVILTARDEKRGVEAVEKLKQSGLSDVIFHRLDVTDSSGIASFAEFIKISFGKLDILVNNAAIGGVTIDTEILNSLKIESEKKTRSIVMDFLSNLQQDYEMAEECLKTNFYGTRDVTQALIPLLLSSNSGRIVNVSAKIAQFKISSSQKLMEVLRKGDGQTEEKLLELSSSFLDDFRGGKLQCNGWPTTASAYTVSKALVNSYTRILAKKYPSLCINCVNPGFVKTDMNWNVGIMTVKKAPRDLSC